jgi:hypothetical protein
MAINFRPISFHCAKTICELLGMAFEASLFCCACCATDGNAHNPVTNSAKIAVLIIFVILILRFSAKYLAWMLGFGPTSYSLNNRGSHYKSDKTSVLQSA